MAQPLKTRVHVPIGAVTPTPVVVVLVDEGRTRDAECAGWHQTTAKRFFTLCQSVGRRNDSLEAKEQERALKAALRNLKRRFGAYVTPEKLTLIGVREGADVAVALIRGSEGFFARIGLIDGGFPRWSAVDSASFARNAASRSLLLCSSPACEQDAARITASLRASGASTKLLRPHDLAENAGEARGRALLWLMESAPRQP